MPWHLTYIYKISELKMRLIILSLHRTKLGREREWWGDGGPCNLASTLQLGKRVFWRKGSPLSLALLAWVTQLLAQKQRKEAWMMQAIALLTQCGRRYIHRTLGHLSNVSLGKFFFLMTYMYSSHETCTSSIIYVKRGEKQSRKNGDTYNVVFEF